LLDLYLAGDFPREILGRRRTSVEAQIASLEGVKAMVVAQIEAASLSDAQIKHIQDFAAGISDGLDVADREFGARRHLIEQLDVQCTLSMEDGEMIAHARCLLGEGAVLIATRNT